MVGALGGIQDRLPDDSALENIVTVANLASYAIDSACLNSEAHFVAVSRNAFLSGPEDSSDRDALGMTLSRQAAKVLTTSAQLAP